MGKRKKKAFYEGEHICPHCNNGIHISVTRTRLNPTQAAEYEYDETIEPATGPLPGMEEDTCSNAEEMPF